MTAFIPTIEPLVTRLAEFTRDRRRRLLHVRVGPELRPAAISLVRAHEHRPENRSPFLVLEAEHRRDDSGWATRVALQLQQLLHARPEGTEGLVVVLAPTRLESSASWREAIEMLVMHRALGDVRWIAVEVETHSLAVLVGELGERADQIDVRVPNDVAVAALADLASARGPAGPRGVVPPPRADVTNRKPDADGERRIALRQLVLTAALASGRRQPAEAIAAQRRARDLCESAGWLGESITMELVLGAQLVAGGAVREAETSFLRALERAREHARHDQVATAGFGLGATRTLRGERHTALVAYAEAALAAEDSGSPVLAIEGSRLAGQAALDLKMEPQAIAFFGRAVRLAHDTDADVSRSSAPLAARTLAAIRRRRSLHARAEELEVQALQFARPQTSARDTTPAIRAEAPRTQPPIEAPIVPAPADIESTALLTLEEIARGNWGGVIDDPSPPAEGSRSWTRDEIRVLQAAVDRSLDEESTATLSPDELAALRGQSLGAPVPIEPVAPAPVDAPDATDEAAALASALAQLVAQGEGRMVMRRDDLERIRKKLLGEKDGED